MPEREDLKGWLQGTFGTPEVSDRVIDFHIEFMNIFDQNYRELVNEIYPALEEIPVHNQYFNDHGSRHSYRIIDNISYLCEENSIHPDPGEQYMLAASAWLHDIGMSINQKISLENIDIEEASRNEWFQEIGHHREEVIKIDNPEVIRKWHHILSWDFVRQNFERLGFPDKDFLIANCVANICRVHRRGYPIEELDEKVHLRMGAEKRLINLQTIAALFQFADGLDTNKNRAPDISSYIQRLPPESKKHWQVCQLINGFDFDPETNLLRLRASHSTTEEKELLKKKAKHIYAEFEDVRSVLISKPYPLTIADVQVKSNYEKAVDAEVTISGRELYIEEERSKEEDLRRDQSEVFNDLLNSWVIDIHNLDGDATISREVTMEFLDRSATERIHFVRSFDNGMEWDWKNDIRAYDQYEEELNVQKVDDRPNNKDFIVEFPDDEGRPSPFIYTYEYNWKGLFPNNEEVYIVTGNGPKTEFKLSSPDEMSIEDIWCEEITQMGTRWEVEGIDLNKDGGDYTGMVEKDKRLNQVAIKWVQTW